MGVTAQRTGWLLAAVLIVAFNLRLGIASPGPVIDQIRADTGMSSSVGGLLVTIPFVCMSAFAFAGPPLIRRGSSHRVITLSLLLVGGGTLARAVAPTPLLLVAATVPIGVGIALAGVALPVVVKSHFSRHSGAVTGAYVAAFSVGVTVIAITIGALAEAMGGWRPAFAISAAPALIALAVWMLVGRRYGGLERSGPAAAGNADPPEVPGKARPDRVELLAAASFGLQSMCYAGLVAWVAALYIELGWSVETAALTTASLGLFVIPGSLLFPSLSQGRDRRPWIAITVAVMAAGVLGVALAPEAAPLVWLLAFGIGGGGAFALQLSLPIDLRAEPHGVARLTAWMLGLGYVLSAIAPALIGTLRDLTGGFTVPMTVLGSVAVLGVAVAMLLPPPLPSRRREALKEPVVPP